MSLVQIVAWNTCWAVDLSDLKWYAICVRGTCYIDSFKSTALLLLVVALHKYLKGGDTENNVAYTQLAMHHLRSGGAGCFYHLFCHMSHKGKRVRVPALLTSRTPFRWQAGTPSKRNNRCHRTPHAAPIALRAHLFCRISPIQTMPRWRRMVPWNLRRTNHSPWHF
jgi:hypothetical protein